MVKADDPGGKACAQAPGPRAGEGAGQVKEKQAKESSGISCQVVDEDHGQGRPGSIVARPGMVVAEWEMNLSKQIAHIEQVVRQMIARLEYKIQRAPLELLSLLKVKHALSLKVPA